MTSQHTVASHQRLLNKVPEVTVYFWVIKVLCTTVGETAADFLNVNLNFGLTGTSLVTGLLLVFALAFQFAADRYRPGRYWWSVALVSVFGTLVTDNLSDVGVPLEATTLVFGVLLAATFLVWHRTEQTLSIHAIITRRRETFYWAAILFTFALGTATGDLMAEVLGLGYLTTGITVAALIAVIAIGWRIGLYSILSFWIIYVLTRPLGASIGDYLSQPPNQGGLGLGVTVTSLIFTAAILGIVGYLITTKADVIERREEALRAESNEKGGMWQTVVVLALILITAGAGYAVRKSALLDHADPAAIPSASTTTGATHPSPLGDLSQFRTITQDTLDQLNSGDQTAATTRITDLETSWDNAEAKLKPKDKTTWTRIDHKIDTALRELRSTSPQPESEKAALTDLLAALA